MSQNTEIDLESGASDPLPFMKNVQPGTTSGQKTTANTWKLSEYDDDDLIDEDELLDEEDRKRPDPASLRVCGTTNLRKACRDCSCGFAEELAGTTASGSMDTAKVKSACGSCGLGDAFRCSTCPYYGSPPFKPGEKVELSDTMMNADT